MPSSQTYRSYLTGFVEHALPIRHIPRSGLVWSVDRKHETKETAEYGPELELR
jgi:hypothetical protein